MSIKHPEHSEAGAKPAPDRAPSSREELRRILFEVVGLDPDDYTPLPVPTRPLDRRPGTVVAHVSLPLARQQLQPRPTYRRVPLDGDVLRAAFVHAARAEEAKRPFHLFGRCHEARCTFDKRLAAFLRSVDLPRVRISGYGPNYHYPLRVVRRAARLANRRLGWEAIGVSRFGHAWVVDRVEVVPAKVQGR